MSADPAPAEGPAPADKSSPAPAEGPAPADKSSSIPAPGPVPANQFREPAVLRVWGSIELGIACVALTAIFVSVLWQVISRYVPPLNWPGVGEVASYSLIVLTFVMVGYLVGNNGHITIEIIDYLVKGRAFIVVKAVSAALTALICAALVWESYELIQAYSARKTAALGIPIWTLYAVPMLGFASGAVRAVVRVFLANRDDVALNAAEAK